MKRLQRSIREIQTRFQCGARQCSYCTNVEACDTIATVFDSLESEFCLPPPLGIGLGFGFGSGTNLVLLLGNKSEHRNLKDRHVYHLL